MSFSASHDDESGSVDTYMAGTKIYYNYTPSTFNSS